MIAFAEPVANVDQKETRQKLFEDLYKNVFPSVSRFVSHRSGSLQDAKDIFQDALVLYYEKQTEGLLTITSSREAYVLGIAKHLWLRKFNRDRDFVALDDFESSIEIPDDSNSSIETNKLLLFLESAGRKCMDLLRAFYYDKDSLSEITDRFGYGSAHSATVQKFKCLEKVRDTVKEKSMRYEDFSE